MRSTDDRVGPFRVEHHEGDARTVLAIDVRPLDAIAARLAAEGKGGYLAVVQAETGDLFIRVPVAPAAAKVAATP
jgi:hypothetical protein